MLQNNVVYLNDSALFCDLFEQKTLSPQVFTDKEKQLSITPMFLKAVIAMPEARELAIRIAKHPLLLCVHFNYPNTMHLRVRNQRRVVKEILRPAIQRNLIGHYMLRPSTHNLVVYDLSFIHGFDSDGAMTMTDPEQFVRLVETHAIKMSRISPADAVVRAIAGEDLQID